MLDIGRKVLFLTGAPLPKSLEWTDEELCAPLQPGFIDRNRIGPTGRSSTDDKAPSWRYLPLEKPHLPTGLTQLSREDPPANKDYGYMNEETSFLTTTSLSFISGDPDEYSSERSQVSGSDKDDVFTQYYEHSFAVHENIPSSQIVGAESFDESFTTEPEDFSAGSSQSNSPEGPLARSRLTSCHLSDLKDMPNAAYLRSITPQTMTVNLVVGIISVSQPRSIKTRKGGRSIELVEMLVGDDTKAGFGINIWLPPSSQEGNQSALQNNDLRTQILHLRPQDVVLAKTVALSSFRGKVYGQSLRRGMTTLDLLYRNVVDGDDARGAYRAVELEQGTINNEPQVRKVRVVKDWVMRFVGANTGALPEGRETKSRLAGEKQMQALPNDTQ